MRPHSVSRRPAGSTAPLAMIAAVLITVSIAYPAVAQTAAKVVAAKSVLRAAPRADAGAVTTVPVGTVVEVLGREGDFYRVLLPVDRQGIRLAGFLRAADLALVGPLPPTSPAPPSGQKAPPGREPAAGKPATATPSGQARGQAAKARPARQRRFSPISLRAFGDLGYSSFLAADSFGSVFGTSRALFLGGGGEVRLGRNLFVRAAVSRTRLDGERVFVNDGEVFRLGISESLTLTPIELTAGWAVKPYYGLTPYVGGGVGLLMYNEQSTGADPGEDVTSRFTSYHVLGGLEYAIWKRLAVAGEFQFTSVPGAVGQDGVSKEFGESDLGGASVRVKLLVGW